MKGWSGNKNGGRLLTDMKKRESKNPKTPHQLCLEQFEKLGAQGTPALFFGGENLGAQNFSSLQPRSKNKVYCRNWLATQDVAAEKHRSLFTAFDETGAPTGNLQNSVITSDCTLALSSACNAPFCWVSFVANSTT